MMAVAGGREIDGKSTQRLERLPVPLDEFYLYMLEGKFMKLRASVKPRCEHCKIIRRNRVVMVICSKDPKHKQKQG